MEHRSHAVAAILGAGSLGGALARTLARRERFGLIRLIDRAGDVAAGKALDIQQATPLDPSRARIAADSHVMGAAGADVILLADPVAADPVEWTDEEGLALLRQLAGIDDRAVIVCAGASHRLLIERGTRELAIARTRLIGSAPVALAAAVRALVAVEADGSPADVSLSVLGDPPDRTVVAWSDATVGGHSLARMLEPPQLARMKARLPRLWPPGPYALASAAARVSEAIVSRSRRRLFSCFFCLDGEFGTRGRASAVPVILGERGVERVVTPSLSVHERTLFETALAD